MDMNKISALVTCLLLTASIGLAICGCSYDACEEYGQDSVLRYVSKDGLYRVVGPDWSQARELGGQVCYPVVVERDGADGRVYWCCETSRGSCGNFTVSSQSGDFSLSDNSFCHSDEMKSVTYMDVFFNGITNRVELERAVD